MRSYERIEIQKRDVNTLLLDEEFLVKYKGKVGCFHADIPYGYWPKDPTDVRWTQATVTTVATAMYRLCHTTGTVVIKMADRDHNVWRTALEQAGFYVERDRRHLLHRLALVRKKSYLSHAATVNALHYWLIAHKASGNNYYVHPKPFGEEGGVCIPILYHPLPSLIHIHTHSLSLHTFTIITRRNSEYGRVPPQFERVRRRAIGPNRRQTSGRTRQNRADPGDELAGGPRGVASVL